MELKFTKPSVISIERAREFVARIAELEGNPGYAQEIRGGCWDHRPDVKAALRGEPLFIEGQAIRL